MARTGPARWAAVAAVVGVTWAPPAAAEVPANLSYQGILTVEGVVVADGQYNLRFQVYDDPDPGEGSLRFEQLKAAVEIQDGLYNVILSTTTPGAMPGDLKLAFQGSTGLLYMQVTVESDSNTVLSVPVALPRQEIASVPFALFAGHAERATSVVGTPPDPIPSGAILLFDGATTCPPGFSEVQALRRRFPIGADLDGTDSFVPNSPGQIGGADGPNWTAGGDLWTTGFSSTDGENTTDTTEADNVSSRRHTHTFVPPFYTVLFCRKS